MKEIGRFHLLTDIHLQKRFSHPELARMAISGGADCIQFRQKSGSTRDMIQEATGLKEICAASGVSFIVNDRVDVALASKADGVHLGQSDFPVPLARKILGHGMIIGGSANTLEEARQCFLEGADYVGFGPVFSTGSKDDTGPIRGTALLRQVVETVPLPIVAIGGIDARRIPDVMKTGAHGIAVISAVCCQVDPEMAAQSLNRALAF